MKNLALLLSVLLFGCGTTEPEYKKVNANKESNEVVTDVSIENFAVPSYNLPATHLNDNNSEILEIPDTQSYSTQKSLNKILNSGDTREIVYLAHPTKELLVYCYHEVRSECYIEGLHNDKFFTYDISQVEIQNKGKLTSPDNPIDSAKTTPINWITVNREYAQLLMTSKIMLNSQQYTLHEPLIINYEKGMMVR